MAPTLTHGNLSMPEIAGVSLHGKTLMVTGGNTGIGLVTAKIFAREGANISILSLGAELNAIAQSEIETLGVRCLTCTGDVTREANMQAAVAQTMEQLGGLHYFFNNAGIAQSGSLLAEQSEAEFDRIIAVDVKGVWLGLKHGIPAIIRSGGGAVVNSSSLAGVKGVPMQAIYCAAKHAVMGLTRAAAIDHAKDGVRVNAIAPGVVNTAMIQRYAAENASMWQSVLDMHPMGVAAEPEEVARAVLFLCRDATKTTGSVINVDSGCIA
jgi:NAD(P)-dependent dehydrogenase (short-subunit alcohol dehydrogenase family)